MCILCDVKNVFTAKDIFTLHAGGDAFRETARSAEAARRLRDVAAAAVNAREPLYSQTIIRTEFTSR